MGSEQQSFSNARRAGRSVLALALKKNQSILYPLIFEYRSLSINLLPYSSNRYHTIYSNPLEVGEGDSMGGLNPIDLTTRTSSLGIVRVHDLNKSINRYSLPYLDPFYRNPLHPYSIPFRSPFTHHFGEDLAQLHQSVERVEELVRLGDEGLQSIDYRTLIKYRNPRILFYRTPPLPDYHTLRMRCLLRSAMSACERRGRADSTAARRRLRRLPQMAVMRCHCLSIPLSPRPSI